MSEAFGEPRPPQRPQPHEGTPSPSPEAPPRSAFDDLTDRLAARLEQMEAGEQPEQGDHLAPESSEQPADDGFDPWADWGEVKIDNNIWKGSAVTNSGYGKDNKFVGEKPHTDFNPFLSRKAGPDIDQLRAKRAAATQNAKVKQQKKYDEEDRKAHNDGPKQPKYEAFGRPITKLVDEASIVFRGINRNGRMMNKDGSLTPEKASIRDRVEALIIGLGIVGTGAIAMQELPEAGENLNEGIIAPVAEGLDIGFLQEFGTKVAELDVPPSMLPAAVAVGGLITVVGRMFGNLRAGRRVANLAGRKSGNAAKRAAYDALPQTTKTEMARTENVFHPVNPRRGQKQWKYVPPAT